MNLSDGIGFVGVTILLVAFLLNLFKKIAPNSYAYILMNLAGAGLACLASILINLFRLSFLKERGPQPHWSGLFEWQWTVKPPKGFSFFESKKW